METTLVTGTTVGLKIHHFPKNPSSHIMRAISSGFLEQQLSPLPTGALASDNLSCRLSSYYDRHTADARGNAGFPRRSRDFPPPARHLVELGISRGRRAISPGSGQSRRLSVPPHTHTLKTSWHHPWPFGPGYTQPPGKVAHIREGPKGISGPTKLVQFLWLRTLDLRPD